MQRLVALVKTARGSLALAALLLALPFCVSSAWPCTFLGAGVLLFAVNRIPQTTGLRRHARLGFGFGFFYHLLIYHWLLSLHPLSSAGITGLPSFLLVCLCYVGASAIHASFFSLSFLLFGFVRRVSHRRSVQSVLFCAAFLLGEALTNVGTLAMPWSRIGLPLASVSSLVYPASVLGPWGVDLVILLFGALLAQAAAHRARARVLSLALAACLFCSYLALGFSGTLSRETGKALTVAVVQTDYSSGDKWNTEASEIRANCRALALSAAESSPDVIVFPESVLASVSTPGDTNEAFFKALSEDTGAYIISGAVFSEAGEVYNAICLYGEEGLISYNAKRHLVPFGEYLPWEEAFELFLPAVAEMDYYRSAYTVGDSGVIGQDEGYVFGGLVCFDSLFTELGRQSVREGAQILFVCTNDSWFKQSPAAKQHLWQAVYRAVESGRCLAQSANTGISALISPTGEILCEASLGEEGVLVSELFCSEDQTLYAKTGDLVRPAALLVLCLAGAAVLFQGRRRHGR